MRVRATSRGSFPATSDTVSSMTGGLTSSTFGVGSAGFEASAGGSSTGLSSAGLCPADEDAGSDGAGGAGVGAEAGVCAWAPPLMDL
eukprot:XP_001706562.1 Hypothetical protein GL50803_94157 [Giardia lamblia ATCC 50803]